MKIFKLSLFISVLLLCGINALFPVMECNLERNSQRGPLTSNEERKIDRQIDFTQAEVMLDFLQSVKDGKPEQKKLEAVLNCEGTDLVIGQMNLARKVTRDQYRLLLSGLIKGTLPDIKPADSSERSKKGVEGLTKNVWILLSWGVDNLNILRKRLESLQSLDIYREAEELALKYLPAPVPLKPSLFIVIGGRAGAAALEGERTYFDILMFSYLSEVRGRPFPSEKEIVSFFAHEIHHIGLSKIRADQRKTLGLDENESRAFDVLSSAVSEGSATYLISEGRSIDSMKEKSSYADLIDNSDELLLLFENLLSSAMKGEYGSEEEFQKALTQFLGNRFHVTGTVMLHAIDKAGGLDAVMRVVLNPRRLLIEYNKAVEELKLELTFKFDPELAKAITSIGK